ncbi:MAG: zinc metallopeptidase [Prosthecobacter sp.]|nr:zinc metallopeptidase [Prosthecobacter sp.]
MFLIIIILVLVLGIGISRHALGRYEQMLRQGGRENAPMAHTGAEMAKLFLESEGIDDIEIVEHTSVVSDYYDPRRRRLFLRPEIARGSSMAAWAVALHEAAHATQTGDSLAQFKWRQTVILMTRYGPIFGAFGAVGMLLLRIHPRIAFLAFMAVCAVVLLLNLGTLAIEFNANARLHRFLEKHLEPWPSAHERLQGYLSAMATRELGDLLRSPRYFFFSGLPGTAKLRPNDKK